MKQLLCTFLLSTAIILINPISASAKKHQHSSRNDTVMLRLSASQWLNTNTAEISVSVNANVDSSGVISMRKTLMAKLHQIAPGQWHITNFDRNVDPSGLQKLLITASARVEENKLANVQDAAKSISKPGQTFRISSISFKPSIDEKWHAEQQLRSQIYNKVKAEIASLNSVYPSQQFQVHRISFIPRVYRAQNQGRALRTMSVTGQNSTVIVSNRLILNAVVVLASPRNNKADNVKG